MPAITRELLEKFWMGFCTEEEATLVEAYFREHPEDESLFEEFEAAGEEPVGDKHRVEMLSRVMHAVRPRGAVVRRIRVTMAAASLLAVVAAGWLIFRPAPGRSVTGPAMSEAAVWVGKHNADNKNVRVMLPDSTETILAPDAIIIYRTDLGYYDKREVKVEGEVVFMVRRNKEQPFIVYSGGVETTVLGTIFDVSNKKDGDHISIRLLQGKVMVGMDAKTGDPAKKYYLRPGEEFVYKRGDRSVAVREFDHKGEAYAVHRARRPRMREDSLANWYMFNDQELADVLDQLAIIYNVEIQYSSSDLRNKYFIGKLEKHDSLTEILKDIALLNHLSVIGKEGCYIIRKAK
ncbi:MAG TPA: FecR domain-containing protein [Puia sp.]|jgi:ferric-dicitrate binding protein FerR (iron transport regulator)|nr:FecR domain-containing protein [Puia sp.]